MLRNVKVNINFSIITLFVLLLSLVGFAIITINYVTLNKILSLSAENSIKKTSQIVKERVLNYLLPFNKDLVQMEFLLKHKILDPSNRHEFDPFVLELIRNNPEIYSVYYGTAEGDSLGIDHERKGVLSLHLILNSKNPPTKVQYQYDEQGNFLKKNDLVTNFDPRNRPWYKQGVQSGKMVWTEIYKFYSFVTSNYQISGISAVVPIYGKDHRLKGVLGMDLTIDDIQRFINELRASKSEIIYITNEKREVIAYKNDNQQEDSRGKKLTPEYVKKLQIPFPDAIFDEDLEDELVTTYKYNGQEYFLAIQQLMMKANGGKPWQITIIVPVRDVLAPLRHMSIRYLIMTLAIMILGSLVARYFSKKISTPIIQLAQEAREIKELNLQPRPQMTSRIKEINYMYKSFANMRSSLISFQRYVPYSLVKQLMKNGKIAEVGGQLQKVTILFSDIKNFTKLSEGASPEQLMIYLSDYFQLMTESVIIHQGMLDKYIGDAIMALWNAPLPDSKHALHACQTAINMMERLEELNKRKDELQRPEFTIRIGIHSGEAVVGNVGSEDRLSFTALGDAVNLTSRLEAINKIYHTRIIVSKSTFDQVKSHFNFRFLDEVAVRGKRNSTAIYELIIEKDISNLEQHKIEFTEAYSYYQKGNWDVSLELFKKLVCAYPGDQLAEVYIERCQILLGSPPSNWDGIWRIDDK